MNKIIEELESKYMQRLEEDGFSYTYYDLEKSCQDTLLRLNIKDDAFKVKEPILNRTLRALDIALDEYNKELVFNYSKQKRIIRLINEDGINQLDELLHSLKDTKLKIHELKNDIDFCIKKVDIYNDYIRG